MNSDKIVNYTAEQTKNLMEGYKAGVSVEQLANDLGKSVRSVIAKLARAGVYHAPSAHVANPRVTKAQIVMGLEQRFQLPQGSLASLEKGDKATLQLLYVAS